MTRIGIPLLRPLTLALILAGAGVVLLGSAASADVTITPAQAVQGGDASITFLVRSQRAGAHTTKVEVDLPADSPIAEVYPMSVPDWAPKITYRRVDQALPGIHGSGLTLATSSVIWTRASDAPAPPAVESLRIDMGPMPNVARFVFSVVQTYSDGTVQRWQGPTASSSSGAGPVLTLTPAAASQRGTAAGGPAPRLGHAQHQNGESVTTMTTATPAGSGSFIIGAVEWISLGVVGALLVTHRWNRKRSAADDGTTSPEAGPEQEGGQEGGQEVAPSLAAAKR